MVLYLHLGPLGFVGLPEARWWYAEASAPLAVLQLLTILAVTSLTAWWRHRRGVHIGL